MIPFSACIAFKDNHDTWQVEPERRCGISFTRTNDLNYFIRVDDAPPYARMALLRRNITPAEYALLETLDLSDHHLRHTGRFLTLNRKRRRVPLRLDGVDGGVFVDNLYHGQSELALHQADQWPFNAFTLDAATGGRALPSLLVHLFSRYGLIDYFELDVVKVWKCFSLVEEGYHSNNPYHNAVHASDVTQAMHCFLQEKKIANHITPMEIMSALIAAVTHDLDHPGVNQPFLIATSNHLAALYKNSSVLENHHWRSAIGCLLESAIFAHMDKTFWEELQLQVRSLILATDITRQQEFLMRFKRYMDEDLLDLCEAENRHFILQIALKCADICNPCRPWSISKVWSDRVCEEFFRQGDFERQLNLPVTSLCDREAMSKPKIQAGFFRFVVTPLFEAWNLFHQTALTASMMENLRINQKKWDQLVEAELSEIEASQAAVESDESDSETEKDEDESEERFTPSVRSLEDREDVAINVNRGRRFSTPLSLPKVLPLTTLRRQSFPRQKISISCGRTLSAEALIPDPRITSISREASRLAGLFADRRGSRPLVKQLTYPPTRSVQHIHSQSWHEACAELLPGVICPSVLKEMEQQKKEPSSMDPADCGSGECKNGCGTPPEFDDEKKANEVVKLAEAERPQRRLTRLCSETMSEESNNKENFDPEILAACRYALYRRHSEESEVLKYTGLSRKTKCQGFLRITGRRGSAPISLLRSEEMYGGLRGGAIEHRRRGSVPIDALSGLQRRRHSADIICYRRGSRRESFLSDTIHVIASESSGSTMTLHDRDLFAVQLQRSCSPDPFRNQFRRSSAPAVRSDLGRKTGLSLANKQGSVPDVQLRKGSGGVELVNTLFRPRRRSAELPPRSGSSSSFAGVHRLWASRHGVKQSESFDLGLLKDPPGPEEDDPGEIVDLTEASEVWWYRRRASLPVEVVPVWDEARNVVEGLEPKGTP